MASRLRQARIAAGFVRATDAVRAFGWTYSRYMNYENGERAIPLKQAVQFASAFGVSVDFLYFGKDENFNKIKGEDGVLFLSTRQIPLVDLNNVVELKRIAGGAEPMFAAKVPVSSAEAIPRRGLFVTITDNSMFDPEADVSFKPGDQALIDLEAKPKPSQYVVAIVPDESAAVLRVYREVAKLPDGTIKAELVPLNPNFRTIPVEVDTTIVGVCRSIHSVRHL